MEDARQRSAWTVGTKPFITITVITLNRSTLFLFVADATKNADQDLTVESHDHIAV